MNAHYSKSYVLNGDPVALARGRFSSINRKVFDSQKQLKLILGINLKNQHDDEPMFTGPLKMDFKFFFQPSSSWTKNKTKQMLDYSWMIYKPDTTNLVKLIEDVCQQAGLFKDDCLVCCVSAEKRWDIKPRTEIIITELR